jgi:hypothetical protein
MFKNLQSGAQPATGTTGDSKIRVDVSCSHPILSDLSR